jgi:CheY-like chemotaxis protein
MIPDAEKLSVMIVAAEPFTRNAFEEAAAENDCFGEPLHAADGFGALALLWEAFETGRLPDVIVIDFELPDLNGIQFAREVRRHAEIRHLFIAVLSPNASELDRVTAETAGVDYFEHYPHLGALKEIFQTLGPLACRNVVS